MEVYPRAPATDGLHAYVDADIWDIGALLETPITDNWSIAVSGRRSYVDAILNMESLQGSLTLRIIGLEMQRLLHLAA